MRKELESQIKKITQTLTRYSIARAHHFPKWNEHDLVWENYHNLSFALKNEKYSTLYTECLKNGDYNLVLIDGALIQMRYRFYKNEMIEHVLCYFPNPFTDQFDENDDYISTHLSGHNYFSEIKDDQPVCCPLRFDFNHDVKLWREINHPKSHLTIGNYKNCRIPVSKPITPNRFMKFVLRSFYLDLFLEHLSDDFFNCSLKFEETIADKEKKQLYFDWL